MATALAALRTHYYCSRCSWWTATTTRMLALAPLFRNFPISISRKATTRADGFRNLANIVFRHCQEMYPFQLIFPPTTEAADAFSTPAAHRAFIGVTSSGACSKYPTTIPTYSKGQGRVVSG